jgi:pantoate--beta-alanine ligase
LIDCPIVRDSDGLALSSRNRYLSQDERALALRLPRVLDGIRGRIRAGERESAGLLSSAVVELQEVAGVSLDYLVIVDRETLLPVAEAVVGSLVAIAATVGTTRLIDNFIVA